MKVKMMFFNALILAPGESPNPGLASLWLSALGLYSFGLQSKRVLRTGGKDAKPLEAEVWHLFAWKTAKGGPQRQGRKGTLGEGARPY